MPKIECPALSLGSKPNVRYSRRRPSLPQVVWRFAIPPQAGSEESLGRCAELLDCRHQSRAKRCPYTLLVRTTLPEKTYVCARAPPTRLKSTASLRNGLPRGLSRNSCQRRPE